MYNETRGLVNSTVICVKNKTIPMEIEEDDNFGDWRIAAVTTLAKDVPAAFPGGPSHKAGAALFQSSFEKHPEFGFLGFITPNPSALSLNMAFKAASNAKRIKKTIAYSDAISPEGKAKQVVNENHAHLYDFFEECMGSVTFSYQAIEVYANREIIRNAKSTISLKRGKKHLTLSPQEAERRLSTEEKIAIVLPKILSIPTPKGKKHWEGFKRLRSARDAIIHMKNKETRNVNEPFEESIYFELLNNDPTLFPKSSFNLISHFFEATGGEPRWAKYLRQGAGI